MSDPQSRQALSLGVSIGATNLAATLDGHAAAIRPSELTVHGQRLTGFVDRIGDPVPLIAADGSTHHADRLLTAAVSALTHELTGAPARETTVAVPAHWPASVVEHFRRGTRLPVVSDASAALTALRANPGLPTHGVIVLCDFGGSGTTVSLVDAASDFAPIGEPVRFPDFSGEHIDQALLHHIAAGLPQLATADTAGTELVGSLSRLRDECRAAKERLSASTATAVSVELPGNRCDFRVTRTELEDLVLPAFAAFLVALDETLEHAGIAAAIVTAVATVGGGARIPLVTQRLSEHLRVPVVTTAHPQLVAAEGAAIIARHSRVVEAATIVVPANVVPASEPSAPFHALAWSEDVPAEPDFAEELDARPEVQFLPSEWADPEPETRRSPLVLFGLAAGAAVIASVVFVLTSFGADTMTPVEAATPVAPSPTPAAPVVSPAAPAPQAPTVTTVVAVPAQRSNPVPQVPATQHPPADPAPPPTDPTTEPTTPPTTETPPTSETPPTPETPENPTTPETPPPPPIDPEPGNGETPDTGGTNPPPIDPGPGDGTGTTTPPIDPGDGTGETGAGAPADTSGNGTGSPGA